MIYDGRCVGGPLDGRWHVGPNADHVVHDSDGERVGVYVHCGNSQWLWMPDDETLPRESGLAGHAVGATICVAAIAATLFCAMIVMRR